MLRILTLFCVLLVAGQAAAQQKDVLRRLMEEPVTLFDWGIAQLDKDIAMTASRTIPKYVGAPVTGSFYDWRANRITLFVSVPVPKQSRTADACAKTFRDIVRDLTRNTPKGPSAAGWYLLNAFKPKAHFWADRFEDVGAKLLDVVTLEVTFIPATHEAFDGKQQRVRCMGRLDATYEELTVEVTS
ncbi:MAG: hypothetical protein JJ900_00795 [Rhodospirillales bacterium]|nr:hypothetical protein [Rhodospirillales bacterium]MBO6785355.1 hypothetical protein [Rhodospirillales bacterium]